MSLPSVACAALVACIGIAPAQAVSPDAIVQTTAVYGAPCDSAVFGTNCQGYFPDVVVDPAGDGVDDLLMVYRWASAHQGVPSQLRFVKSTDGGATWGTPSIVMSSQTLDFRDPSLSVASSGRLFLSYFTQTVSTGGSNASQVRYRDPGWTSFTDPVTVKSSTLAAPYTTAKIVQLANGQLLMPVYGTPKAGGPHQSAIIASTDGGATWDGTLTGHQKTVGSSSSIYYQEPAVAEIEPGHVRMIIRSAWKDSNGNTVHGPGYQADSYNNTYMTTWGAPVSLTYRMHAPELFRIPGTNLVPTIWSQPNAGPAGSVTSRPTIIRMRHTDVLWEDTPSHTLYTPTSGWDSGYSGSVAIGTTRMVSVVYDTSRRGIFAVRYNVADVDIP
jgi:hypothetical protein